jgi:hypothetical protein
VKYANDVRYDSESIATHDKQTLTAVSTTKLFNLVRASNPFTLSLTLSVFGRGILTGACTIKLFTAVIYGFS